MKFKKVIFKLHKILGLATGLVVFIVATTGSCWVFKEEIESLYNSYKKITPVSKKVLTPTEVKKAVEGIFPKNDIHGVVYKKADDALEVIFYNEAPEFYQSIFVHPNTGNIIQIDDHLSGFFAFVLKGHTHLWLPKEIGEQIIGISVLIFILITISGFILWLPKKRKNLKNRLKFDWKKSTKWKRKNFDLHSIVGFYICSFALILAFTGAIMSYDWLQYIVYKSSGGEKEIQFEIPKNNTNSTDSLPIAAIDKIIPILQKELPNAESFELHYPHTKNESIYIEISNTKGLFYDSDFRFFDQNTLEEIETTGIYGKYKDAKLADKILRMNYDIHIGAIGGLTGKIIAFISSLLIASLPITGILLWYGRNYKKK